MVVPVVVVRRRPHRRPHRRQVEVVVPTVVVVVGEEAARRLGGGVAAEVMDPAAGRVPVEWVAAALDGSKFPGRGPGGPRPLHDMNRILQKPYVIYVLPYMLSFKPWKMRKNRTFTKARKDVFSTKKRWARKINFYKFDYF